MTDVGRREGKEEELEGQGTSPNFGGIQQCCGTVSAPTFVNVCVRARACLFSACFSTQ